MSAQATGGLVASGAAPVVWLRQERCEPARYAASALLPLLKLELASLQLKLQPWPEGDESAQTRAAHEGIALIGLRCADSADGIELALDDFATGVHSVRVLVLGDVGAGAKERALALAVASSLEQSLSAALAPSQSNPAPNELPPAVAEALRARMQQRLALPAASANPVPALRSAAVPVHAPLELSAMTRLFPSYSTGLLGVQGGVSLALDSALVLDLDAEALAGQSELSDAAGTVGKMWLYWLSAGLGLSWHSSDQPQLSLGPRVRLGYALADASVERAGASAHDDHSVLLALLAVASLRAPISRNASLLLAFDFGYTVVGIVFVGDQARLSGMAGITASLRVGIAL